MNLNTCVFLTEKLLAISLIIQSVELIYFNRVTDSYWRWEHFATHFKKHFPKPVFILLKPLLSSRGYDYLNLTRLILAVFLLLIPAQLTTLYILLIFSTLVLNIKWLGASNGGSDHMTMHLLIGLFLYSLYPLNENIQNIIAIYIGTIALYSYFHAGLVKIKKLSWIKGEELKKVLNSKNYLVSQKIRNLFKKKELYLIASIAFLIFELSAPLVLYSTYYACFFLIVAFLFHIFNFITFGLNRFIFAWLASYPMIYYLSQFASN